MDSGAIENLPPKLACWYRTVLVSMVSHDVTRWHGFSVSSRGETNTMTKMAAMLMKRRRAKQYLILRFPEAARLGDTPALDTRMYG